MTTLVGSSRGIVVGLGTTGRCGPGTTAIGAGGSGTSTGGGAGGGGGGGGGAGGGGTAGGGATGGGTSITVPGTIDPTGSTNVQVALAAFLNSVPTGSTVLFPPTATYRIDSALKLSARQNILFEGQGCGIFAAGSGHDENYSIFYFQHFTGPNSQITIRDFLLTGNSPTPGVYIAGQEGQHGVIVDGSQFEITNVTGSAFYGDFVFVPGGTSFVHVHGNTITNTGRNGLSIISGNNVEWDHNAQPLSGYMPFDLEPATTGDGPSFLINIHDNTTGLYSNAFFAVDGSHTGNAISDITVANNVSTGRSLLTIVNNGHSGVVRNPNIVFTNNSSNVTANGPVLQFSFVDGLTVTHNTQPLSSGSLVSTSGCTDTILTPNP